MAESQDPELDLIAVGRIPTTWRSLAAAPWPGWRGKGTLWGSST